MPFIIYLPVAYRASLVYRASFLIFQETKIPKTLKLDLEIKIRV